MDKMDIDIMSFFRKNGKISSLNIHFNEILSIKAKLLYKENMATKDQPAYLGPAKKYDCVCLKS